MENYIKIIKINKNKNIIEIDFDVCHELMKYFKEKNFWCEYDFDVENIPNSIACIPFLCNVLPIIWLTDSSIILEEIDEDFYQSIDCFKKGYINMYPQLDFKETNMIVDRIIKNNKNKTNKNGCFFSGGVDAFATLFSHIDEKPLLITVWGADVATSNIIGWKDMKEQIDRTANEFNLDNTFVKSNFKEFLNTSKLNNIILESNDKWWHGFQHGIGLIGLSAPISWKEQLDLIYIASSYTIKDKVTCASSPLIDEFVKFCKTDIHHDQFELNRQMKIKKIVDVANKIKKFPNLHVCWEKTTGANCCKCEKCCRTMVGIMIANDNPSKYGFNKWRGNHIKNRMRFFNKLDDVSSPMWNDLKQAYEITKNENNYRNELDWILSFSIKNNNYFYKKILRKVEKYLERK